MEPSIISSYDGGRHVVDLEKTISRLDADAQYRDLSTVVILPTFKPMPIRVVASHRALIMPPNNNNVWLYAAGMEVGEAYSRTLEQVLAHPVLSTWKYLLTIEHDNMPPADGLLKLLARMEAKENASLAAIGGLYFTKGEGGCAQIWGAPYDMPLNFRPQKPDPNGGLVECCGTGMGFTLFRLSMFKDKNLRKPWFKTQTEGGVSTQDLFFWSDARKNGHRCAVDCSVKVGHYDDGTDTVW